MTAAERDIPLREVPATIRDLRASWAQEYTRANAFERENADLRSQLDAMRARDLRNIDDLTDLYRGAKARTEHVESMYRVMERANVAIREQIGKRHAEESKALLQFVRDVWEEIEASDPPRIEVIRDVLREFIAEHGEACDVCGGEGEVADEADDWSFSVGRIGRMVVSECQHCRFGKVPR